MVVSSQCRLVICYRQWLKSRMSGTRSGVQLPRNLKRVGSGVQLPRNLKASIALTPSAFALRNDIPDSLMNLMHIDATLAKVRDAMHLQLGNILHVEIASRDHNDRNSLMFYMLFQFAYQVEAA